MQLSTVPVLFTFYASGRAVCLVSVRNNQQQHTVHQLGPSPEKPVSDIINFVSNSAGTNGSHVKFGPLGVGAIRAGTFLLVYTFLQQRTTQKHVQRTGQQGGRRCVQVH